MLSKILLSIIRFYQLCISPMMAPHCRFSPSCSQYAIEAIKTHGALKGAFLAIKRISKCHPFHEGGHDPVPAKSLEKKFIKIKPNG